MKVPPSSLRCMVKVHLTPSTVAILSGFVVDPSPLRCLPILSYEVSPPPPPTDFFPCAGYIVLVLEALP
ncbi:hypothetical protein Pdw03_3604 [Penicillium digitatum]|uniref:Uncharacterized protein n=1 Tax=Penicillium digitatum TaxID=36651 RepID=A0A7T6XGI5_PENDI|nr:hypothetical protein Pdw03_3604 [Penicillium digitatum]